MSTVQPKIVQKAALRFAIGLLILAGLILAYNFFRTSGQDLNNLGRADTAGWIAALRDNDEGTQLVVIKPDGSVLESPNYRSGANDREYAWRPDGNQIIFTSDREANTFRMFRWNLANGSLEARTAGTRNYSNPSYPPPGAPFANDAALVTSGGFVAEFDPVKLATVQLLPPTGRDIQLGDEEGSGGTGQFDQLYKTIGTSFKFARWNADRNTIVAVMRADEGEVLVAQSLEVTDKGLAPPQILAAGDSIDFDVSPTENVIVYTVNRFRFPDPNRVPEEFVKEGRVVVPFRHMVGIANLDKPDDADRNGVMASSGEDELSFTSPRFAPNGNSFALGVGPYEESTTVMRVANIPARVSGAAAGSAILDGRASDLAWSPDGRTLLFVRSEDGNRAIYSIGVDGGGLKKIAEGAFRRPTFSPQAPN